MTDAGYTSAYFGLSDRANEGTWMWCNNESVVYTNWHSGEPNSENSNEDYGMFYWKFSDGTWNDGDFGGSTVSGGVAYICEWDSEAAYSSYRESLNAVDANELYNHIIANRSWMDYVNEDECEYEIVSDHFDYFNPECYAELDIDQNGTDELLISFGDGYGFYVTVILSYDDASDQVVFIGAPYSYINVMYSPGQHAIAYYEYRSSSSDSLMRYDQILNYALALHLLVGHEGWNYDGGRNSFIAHQYGENQAITDAEEQEYYDELQVINWIRLD